MIGVRQVGPSNRYLILVLTLLVSFCWADEPVLTDSDKADIEYFNKYVEQIFEKEKFNHMGNPLRSICLPAEDYGIQSLMDEVILQVHNAFQEKNAEGARLERAIRLVTNFKQLANEDLRSAQDIQDFESVWTSNSDEQVVDQFSWPSTSHKGSESVAGLLDLINKERPLGDGRVVHSLKRVNKDLLRQKIHELPKYELKYLIDAGKTFTNRQPSLNGLIRRKRQVKDSLGGAIQVGEVAAKTLIRLVMQVLRLGEHILDWVNMTPEFIMNIPVLGEQIVELKKKGETIYKLIDFVRHSNYLYKLSRCPPTRKLVKSNSGEVNEIVELSDDDANNLVFENCSGYQPDSIQTARAKSFVSEQGSLALQKIASKVAKDFGGTELNIEGQHEFMSRTAYALLTFVLPQASEQAASCARPTTRQ